MTRTWPALFAWGAGLLHIALGAAVASGVDGAATVVVLSGLIALGSVELAWGVAAMRADTPPLPRVAAAGAVVAIGSGVLALTVGGALYAVAAASALAAAAGAIAAGSARARARRVASGDPTRPRTRGIALPVVLGAVLVAGISTPALATTDAGLNAIHDMGTMGAHSGH